MGCGGTISSSTGGGGGGGSGECTPVTTSSVPASCPALVSQAGVAITGKVMAGEQPVSGAAVELYAAGNASNGSAPTALLQTAVTTGTAGTFTVPAGYSCPSAQTPIYLVSKGGQAGPGATANASLWLMTAIGPCGGIATGSSFAMNEVTTAAAVWSLASFMSSGGKVGASCTNTTGLDNAFMTANNLVNASTGASPGGGVPATLTVSTSKLNTLANAIASCTGSSGGSACSGLFNAAAAGSSVPSNTLDAALDIAHAPGNNVATIYSLAAGSAIYTPALSAAPPDWMLHNTVKGGGMASPASMGVSAAGDVWVSNYFNTIAEFSPAGAAEFPSGITGSGINQSYGMALDAEGNVWIANEQTNPNSGLGDVAELSSAGAAVQTSLTVGGINFPIAVAADSNGNVWFADYGDSKVSVLDSEGAAVSSSGGWGGTSLAFPVALAVDSSHNAWAANQGGLLPITKISPDGSQVTDYDCECDGGSGIAIDQAENVWVANYYGNSISEVNSCGTLVLGAAAGGGVDHPQGIAVDGQGTVWVTNFLSNSLSEMSSASSSAPGTFLSPSTGFGTDASILQPYGLAIDASGSIWVSNFGNSTLTQFIGVASPVKTPLVGPPQQP
jgi:streptogramin lyase